MAEGEMGTKILDIQPEILSCFRMHNPIVNMFMQRKTDGERDANQSAQVDASQFRVSLIRYFQTVVSLVDLHLMFDVRVCQFLYCSEFTRPAALRLLLCY